MLTVDHDVLTDKGWKRPTTICDHDKIATLNIETKQLEYSTHIGITYSSIAHAMGVYHVQSNTINLLVSLDHELYCKIGDTFAFRRASDVYKQKTSYYKSANAITSPNKHKPEIGIYKRYTLSEANELSIDALDNGLYGDIEPIKHNNKIVAYFIQVGDNREIDIDPAYDDVYEHIYMYKSAGAVNLDTYFDIDFGTPDTRRPIYVRRVNKGCWI